MAPLVSICLPNLNTRPFIEERMESLLSQTLGDWELVICDSHSADGSWELFQRFESDRRVRLHQVAREGVYAGWNECLRRATGEYVYIATSDDTCKPDLLEKMVGALEQARENPFSPESSDTPILRYSNTPLLLAVCDFDFIDEESRIIDPAPRGVAKTFYGAWLDRAHRRSRELELLVHLCLDISWTTMTAVVFRRSLLEKTGLFRTDCAAFADRFWAIRSACHTDTVYVPGRLATWRWHSAQGSGDTGDRMRRRILRLTAETLDECESMIPGRWKKDSDWRARLLWGSRQHYREGFGLNRRDLKAHPGQFLSDCLRAAVGDPAYLARRLLSGLSWDTEDMLDDHEYTNRLIQRWNVPWPPTPL